MSIQGGAGAMLDRLHIRPFGGCQGQPGQFEPGTDGCVIKAQPDRFGLALQNPPLIGYGQKGAQGGQMFGPDPSFILGRTKQGGIKTKGGAVAGKIIRAFVQIPARPGLPRPDQFPCLRPTTA